MVKYFIDSFGIPSCDLALRQLRIMGGIGFFLRNDKNKIVVPSIKIRIFTKANRIV